MHFNHLRYFFIIGLNLTVLTACTKPPELEELEQGFYQHQATFEALSELACALKSAINTKFLRYQIHGGHQFDENLLSQFNQLDQLLSEIDSEDIVISQDGAPECSLFITQWSSAFGGDGAYIGYSYQPAKISEYQPELSKSDSKPQSEVHFTKPLASGWYIEYEKY